MRRAALYTRVSSRAQAGENKVSIAEQFAEMEAHCQRREYQVVARYQDVAPGSTKRRPDFQRMLTDARDGAFDVILCWKADRLSRGIYPAAALMEVVEAKQLELESVTDTLDLKTFSIYAAVGKMEIDNFRERSALGKRGAAKRGRAPIGSLPYGYRTGEDGKPVINLDEARIVQRVFDEYVHQDLGSYSIAKRLTADGAPMRKASRWGSWSASRVLRLLGQEAYRGTWWYGRQRHILTEDGRKHFDQPRDTWIPIPVPPLVDEETWQRAQSLKPERRSRARRNTRVVHLLQHLLFCEQCGLRFGARTNRRSTVRRGDRQYHYEYAEPVRYYICHGMLHHKTQCREHPYLRAVPIEELVWAEVARVLRHPETIVQGMEAQTRGQDPQVLEAEITRAERELSTIQAEEDRLIAYFAKGKLTEAQLDRQRKFIVERLEGVRSTVGHLKVQRRALQDKQSTAEAIATWAREVETGLDALTPIERQEVLRLVLDRVSIDSAGNVQVTLAVPAPMFVSDALQPSSSPGRSRCRWPG